jgi:hypothetical protein
LVNGGDFRFNTATRGRNFCSESQFSEWFCAWRGNK